MMLVPFVQNIKYLTELNDTTFKITQCNLHKSATHWCIPRVRKGKGRGLLFQRPIVSHIKMEGTPPWLQHKYTKIRLFFATLHPLLQNGAFAPQWSNYFTCLGELMICFKDFFFFFFCYVRYYLSLVTRNPVFGVFGQLRFNLVCSATDVS